MKSRFLGTSLALALVATALAPAMPASAANGILSGVVTFDGAPVDNVRVGWFKPSTGTYKSTVTEDDGSYSLALPKAGTEYIVFSNADVSREGAYEIEFEHTGVFYGAGDKRALAFQKLAAYTSGSADDVVDIQLTEAAQLTVSHTGIAGQTLELLNYVGETVSSKRVGSSGTYTFEGLVAGTYKLRVTRTGNYLPWQHTTKVAEGQSKTLVPEFAKGGVLRGIVSSDGEPLSGVYVYATRGGQEFGDTTDADGEYRIEGLVTGMHVLRVGTGVTSTRSARYESKSIGYKYPKVGKSVRQDITLRMGGKIFGSFPAGDPATTMTLKVLRSDGTPIFRQSYAGDAPASGKRSIQLSGIKAGTYTVIVSDPDTRRYALKTVTVRSGTSTSLGSFTLGKKMFALSGRLSGLGSSAAGRNYVYVESAFGDSVRDRLSTEGKYRIYLVPGKYTVHFTAWDRTEVTVTRNYRKAKTLNRPAGARLGAVTGIFRLDGQLLDDGYVYFDRGSNFNTGVESADFVDGRATLPVAPGWSEGRVELGWPFLGKTPYYVDAPAKLDRVRVRKGKTNNLGYVDLVIKG